MSVRIRLARFTPSESVSHSRAPARSAILHTETDLLARIRGSTQGFVAVPSYGELIAKDYVELEARYLAYLEANT